MVKLEQDKKELKESTTHLEYAFLGDDSTYPRLLVVNSMEMIWTDLSTWLKKH